MKNIEITGKVYKKVFAKGSKSEHNAIFIASGNEEYKLQREGGNPFVDPELNALEGKTIVAKGIQEDYLFIMKEYTILD